MRERPMLRFVETLRRFGSLALAVLFAANLTQASLAGTLVSIDTSMGTVLVDLFDDVTPLTTTNFLNYVNDNRYQNTIVHRAADLGNPFPANTPFVVQGGGYPTSQFTVTPRPSAPAHIPTFSSPLNEFKITNARGTIAMAKLGTDPNSATSEWFVNLRDNAGSPAFLDTQNGGFTVFGWVVSGMGVMDAITNLPTTTEVFTGGSFQAVPKNGGSFVNTNNISVVKTHPSFQNPIAGMERDVNNDSMITALDMLVIINDLIANGAHAANASFVGSTYAYLDVNGSGTVTSLDLLNVINHFLPQAPPAPSMVVAPIPEPSGLALAVASAIGVGSWALRRRARVRHSARVR
jgi:peptidyl-prolyl cis-trans isomerase A (cyclophilin A)